MEYIRIGFRNLWRKKGRYFLTVLGIAIGVMSVVVISLISEVGKSLIFQEIQSMGMGSMLISTEEGTVRGGFAVEQMQLLKEEEGIAGASPFLTKYGSVSLRDQTEACLIWGIEPDTADIVSLQLLHGKMISDAQVASHAYVCVVDESFAQKYYKRSNIIGKEIDLWVDRLPQTFTVIGVVQSGGNLLQNFMGSLVPCFVYTPYTTLQTMCAESTLEQIVIQVEENGAEDGAVETACRNLAQEMGIASEKIVVQDLNGQIKQLYQVLDVISAVLALIAGISLFVAGISIMTAMLISVQERKKEIGIKKAIGAKRRMILAEFLSEAFLINLFGILGGLLLGLLLGSIGCALLQVHVIINGKMLGVCCLTALAMGMLFGIYPAAKACAMPPVEALRCD